MVKRLVFHLGDHKTGSTSIQYTLARGDWKSDRLSLFYPARINHNKLGKALTMKSRAKKIGLHFGEVRKLLDNSNADMAVISAETFELADPELLYETIGRYFPDHAKDARLISYVRPHADRVLSSYAQMIKVGKTSLSLDGFHKKTKQKRNFIYHPRIKKMKSLFGDRFEVRPMTRDTLVDGDVVKDFFNFVFDGSDFALTAQPLSNESSSLEDLSMIRELYLRLNANPELKNAVPMVGGSFGRILASQLDRTGTKLRLHQSLVQEIVESYRADAELMDKDFFENSPLSDALLAVESKAVGKAQSIKLKDNFSPDTVRLVKAWINLVEQMLGYNPKAWPKHFRALREADLFDTKTQRPKNKRSAKGGKKSKFKNRARSKSET